MTVHDTRESDNDGEPTDAEIKRSESLSGRWRFYDPEFVRSLNLPRLGNETQNMAIERVLASAYHGFRKGRELSHGRSRSDYVGMQRYHGEFFTFNNIIPSIEALRADNWMKVDLARKGSRGWRSTLELTPSAIERIEANAKISPSGIISLERYDPVETVRLRNFQKRQVDYNDNDLTRAMQRNMSIINEATRATSIEINAGVPVGLLLDGRGYERIGRTFTTESGSTVTVDQAVDQYHRVFNNSSWECGGRLYGHWAQSVPKADRARILINGERTKEPDFEEHHARILYVRAGKRQHMPPNPFEIDGWDRKVVKRAFYTLLNADSPASAHGAIRLEIIKRQLAKDGDASKQTTELIKAIYRKHHTVANYFGSGIGRELQNDDSAIAENVMLSTIAAGYVSICVHDSFRAQERLEGRTHEIMLKAWCEELRKRYPDEMEKLYAAGDGRPPMLLIMPQGQEPDLFGWQVTVPKAELKAWHRGVMPKAASRALRHLQACKGLKQDDMAAALGISRPQYTNALQGTFGLGVEATERAKAILESAAA